VLGADHTNPEARRRSDQLLVAEQSAGLGPTPLSTIGHRAASRSRLIVRCAVDRARPGVFAASPPKNQPGHESADDRSHGEDSYAPEPRTKIEAALIGLSGEIPAILTAPRLKVRYRYRWWLVWPR
jgi:hypothetical protein